MEGQIASLEEKKAAAEGAHLRAQNELKEAQDLVNATKKHSAVLQDTLTVSEVDIDVDIGGIMSLLSCEVCRTAYSYSLSLFKVLWMNFT